MTTLIADPRVAAIPVRDNGEPLVRLDWIDGSATGPARWVRAGLAVRLAAAQRALPPGLTLYLAEGYREASAQRAIEVGYADQLRRGRPELSSAELATLTSRYVAPLAVAPHVAGAAVDITLAEDGQPIWMGSPLDATPEESHGRCFFDSPDIGPAARRRRVALAAALGGAGLVNYPTEWWHWSHGDRYWAYLAGATAAHYGPVGSELAA